jgi:CRP-like cAMP-binding protein
MKLGMNGIPSDNSSDSHSYDQRSEFTDRFIDDAVGIDRAGECYDFLRSVPILGEINDSTLWDLAHDAQIREFDPGERVMAQGSNESDKHFYIIRSGSADVVRRDRAGFERPVARLGLGSYFGELGLLTNQARNATVRVRGSAPLRVYAFDALTFHSKIAEHVLVFRVLKARQLPHSKTSTGRGRMRIKDIDLFRRMPATDLQYVLQHAEQRWYPQRAPIVHQGDAGDRFYIVLEGGVDVIRDGECIAHLAAGEFFGETALLLDTPRTASIRATEHTLTWSITRAAFQRIVGTYLLSNPNSQLEVMRRLNSARGEG